MGLFDQILGAIDNPNQQASPDQVGNILGMVQQMAGSHGVDPNTTQAVLSIVGSHVRSALQQQAATGGSGQAEAIVNQFGDANPNTAAVQSIFSPQQQQNVIQEVAQRTGLNAGTIQAMLPILVPIVLNLLKTGASTGGQPQSNPVLGAFLDADNNGAVDIGDAISIAGRFLGQR